MRAEIAHGKAYGALAMGMGSRALFQRAQEQAYFIDAVNKPRPIRKLAELTSEFMADAFKKQGFAATELVTRWKVAERRSHAQR